MKPFSILIFFFFILNLNAQIEIKGKVIDGNGEYLIGAAVLELETQNGTSTDINGYFSLVVLDKNTTISVSYMGYETENLVLNGETEVTIQLAPSADVFDCELIIIVRASPINVTIPAPYLKIPREYLKRDIDLSITPSLNRVPGVHAHAGALNTNRITIRGIGNRSPFSTTKIRAYLDDIPLTTGDGETAIEDIDLSLIDEVKVWKGPTASIYGAGLGGMIHLQTVNQRNVGGSWASTQFTAGSYGLLRNSTTANISTNQKYNLRFNYNNTYQDGYRDNNEYDREGFSFLGKFTPNRKNTTTLLANYTDVKAFIPSSLNRENH